MIIKMCSALAVFTLVTVGVAGILAGELASSSPAPLTESRCNEKGKCFECIQTLGCMWCNDKNFTLEARCFPQESQIKCMASESPQGKVEEDNDQLNDESNKIRPQVVSLSLRKGEKLNVTLEYTDEKNRPLDLYIVMDLSCSMRRHKEKVAKLASSLAANLKNLTSNLRIGFGSFIDKPLAPFGFLQEKKTEKCENTTVQYFPYGFKNNLKLTDDIGQFIKGVESSGISSNIDYPEGTLDGLLQSVVCTDEIGWRSGKGNRKLVVISTDGSFHMAGDGKLVGVVLPHDGECHVNPSGVYTHDTILDYPSVSLVRQKIKKNDMFVIFAVTKDQEETYQQLSKQFHPFAVTQGIDNENNSITTVIQDEYKKLVSTVTLLSEYNLTEYIGVRIYAQCPGEKEFRLNETCNEVGPGVTVSFKIEVELKDCPSNRSSWQSMIKLNPLSSKEDRMLIQLNMLCGCDCEAEKFQSQSSQQCSNNGHMECGICSCTHANYTGPFCNCSVESGQVGNNQCVDPDTRLKCNKRGKCDSCGNCVCDAVNGNSNARSGKYCQCDNTDCPIESGDKGLCNSKADDGPHGECKCSRCVCNEKMFEGSRCECPKGDDFCKDPESKDSKPCNGVGSCQCGKCVCGQANKGKFCEIRHARMNGSCEFARGETEKCVKCLVTKYQSGETDGRKYEMCEEDCKGIAVYFRNDTFSEQEEEENSCKDHELDSKGCRVDYMIREKNIRTGTIHLEIDAGELVQREKCPKAAPFLEIMIGIISAMVLIGLLLLLLWKVVTHIQDRRDYERFEKEIQGASWNTNENPLYKATTSNFKNPVYMDYDENEDEQTES